MLVELRAQNGRQRVVLAVDALRAQRVANAAERHRERGHVEGARDVEVQRPLERAHSQIADVVRAAQLAHVVRVVAHAVLEEAEEGEVDARAAGEQRGRVRAGEGRECVRARAEQIRQLEELRRGEQAADQRAVRRRQREIAGAQVDQQLRLPLLIWNDELDAQLAAGECLGLALERLQHAGRQRLGRDRAADPQRFCRHVNRGCVAALAQRGELVALELHVAEPELRFGRVGEVIAYAAQQRAGRGTVLLGRGDLARDEALDLRERRDDVGDRVRDRAERRMRASGRAFALRDRGVERGAERAGRLAARRDLAQQAVHVARRRARRLGELADFRRDDREAAPVLAGARGFDRRVQRQQVGALGDFAHEVDDRVDLLGQREQLADRGERVLRDRRQLAGGGRELFDPVARRAKLVVGLGRAGPRARDRRAGLADAVGRGARGSRDLHDRDGLLNTVRGETGSRGAQPLERGTVLRSHLAHAFAGRAILCGPTFGRARRGGRRC